MSRKRNTWAYIYYDELPELFDHFGVGGNRNGRLKVKFLDWDSIEDEEEDEEEL